MLVLLIIIRCLWPLFSVKFMTTIITIGTYYILCSDELVVCEYVHIKLHFPSLLRILNL